jgi:hypothetical protein
MNNVIEFSKPAPSCLVPITHPARAFERATDVERTFQQYRTTDLVVVGMLGPEDRPSEQVALK